MNKTLFSTKKTTKTNKLVDNAAGGKSYELSAEQALAAYAVTCCFNDTFYASAESHVDKLKELLEKVNPTLIAKVAVYSHQQGNMKDTPAYLLSFLFSKGESELVCKIFNRIITNAKMLCNFVQLVRSGAHGRKSFGSVGRRLIQEWLKSRSAEQLFKDSVGHSNPALVDIISMTHPKFNESQDNMVKYLKGYKYDFDALPELVQRFERLKKGENLSPEGLDFRLLSNLKLSDEQWSKLACGMTWNALRMNLNNLSKHNVFDTDKTPILAKKLSDKQLVQKANAFPYQLLTTYQNTTNVPDLIKDSIELALENATENVPDLGNIAVAIDVSGSMSTSVTGNGVVRSVTTCVDVAALIASTILRTSAKALILPFDTQVREIKISKYDSVLKNSKKLAIDGGGTNCSVAMKYLFESNWDGDVVFYVSDNMSWHDFKPSQKYAKTPMVEYWDLIKKRNPKAKLILLDITPNSQSQHYEDGGVLHVSGFSDSVWSIVQNFVNGDGNFLQTIDKVEI